MTMPGIDMLALARTVPTSTSRTASRPELDRESVAALAERAGRRHQHNLQIAGLHALHDRAPPASASPDSTAVGAVASPHHERSRPTAPTRPKAMSTGRHRNVGRAVPQVGIGVEGPSRRSCSQKKITGVTISTWRSDEIMPPSTGVASGFITSAPTRVLHMIGQQARDDGAHGHHLRAQAQERAFHHGIAQSPRASTCPPIAAASARPLPPGR